MLAHASLTDFSHRASNHDPHRGFGYVEFSLAEDAREAIDNMDQSELYGRVIKVNQAKPQKDASEGLGSRTAIWEQVSHAVATEVKQLGANAGNRKATPPNTTSLTRRQMRTQTVTNLRIQCKGSRDWLKPVRDNGEPTQSRSRNSSLPVVASCAFKRKAHTVRSTVHENTSTSHAFQHFVIISRNHYMTIYSPSTRSIALRHLKAWPYLPPRPLKRTLESRRRAFISNSS